MPTTNVYEWPPVKITQKYNQAMCIIQLDLVEFVPFLFSFLVTLHCLHQANIYTSPLQLFLQLIFYLFLHTLIFFLFVILCIQKIHWHYIEKLCYNIHEPRFISPCKTDVHNVEISTLSSHCYHISAFYHADSEQDIHLHYLLYKMNVMFIKGM